MSSEALERLIARARKHGEFACQSAFDSGDYENYLREGLDPGDLSTNAYYSPNSDAQRVLKKELAQLSAAERATLPPEQELWGALADAWFDAWDKVFKEKRDRKS